MDPSRPRPDSAAPSVAPKAGAAARSLPRPEYNPRPHEPVRCPPCGARPNSPGPLRRSEEHTSELQSQSNLVCRLLLEKKKKGYHCRQSAADQVCVGSVGFPLTPALSPVCVFFFNDTATTEIYTLSLHDALPISSPGPLR